MMRPTAPSLPSSIPSYKRCATPMVRRTLKPNWREASCCSLLVVKGAVGLRRRSFFSTFCTDHLAFSSAATTASICCLLGKRRGIDCLHDRLFSIDAGEARGEPSLFVLLE